MYKNGKQKELKNAKTSKKFAIFPFPLVQYMSKEGHFSFSKRKKGVEMVILMNGNGKIANFHDHFSPLFCFGKIKMALLAHLLHQEEKGLENKNQFGQPKSTTIKNLFDHSYC